MGLLDEAIREHLELKRRRGADPGEVAREEREALDPAYRAERDVLEEERGEPAPAPESSVDAASGAPPTEELAVAGASETIADNAGDQTDPMSEGDETAELDMERVLQEDDKPTAPEESVGSEVPHGSLEEHPAQPASSEAPPGTARARSTAWGSEDEEAPRTPDERADVHGDVPGQERLSFE
jgi:hypothetical protein